MKRIDAACRIMVIPDVHGRTFWREPVHEALENSRAKVIFLGDYVDTYPYEFDGMDPYVINRRAIGIFKEIIELKKKYPDRMTLLLGNHDCTYAISTSICECRTDYKNFEEIRELFVADRDLFRLADETTINGRHFIFSHAGINQRYARLCFGSEADESNVVGKFNHAYHVNDPDILMSLGMASRWRGNWDSEYGSIVWACPRNGPAFPAAHIHPDIHGHSEKICLERCPLNQFVFSPCHIIPHSHTGIGIDRQSLIRRDSEHAFESPAEEFFPVLAIHDFLGLLIVFPDSGYKLPVFKSFHTN